MDSSRRRRGKNKKCSETLFSGLFGTEQDKMESLPIKKEKSNETLDQVIDGKEQNKSHFSEVSIDIFKTKSTKIAKIISAQNIEKSCQVQHKMQLKNKGAQTTCDAQNTLDLLSLNRIVKEAIIESQIALSKQLKDHFKDENGSMKRVLEETIDLKLKPKESDEKINSVKLLERLDAFETRFQSFFKRREVTHEVIERGKDDQFTLASFQSDTREMVKTFSQQINNLDEFFSKLKSFFLKECLRIEEKIKLAKQERVEMRSLASQLSKVVDQRQNENFSTENNETDQGPLHEILQSLKSLKEPVLTSLKELKDKLENLEQAMSCQEIKLKTTHFSIEEKQLYVSQVDALQKENCLLKESLQIFKSEQAFPDQLLNVCENHEVSLTRATLMKRLTALESLTKATYVKCIEIQDVKRRMSTLAMGCLKNWVLKHERPFMPQKMSIHSVEKNFDDILENEGSQQQFFST